MYSTHHALTNLKFGSCTVLLSSPPVIEALKLVPVEVEVGLRLHLCDRGAGTMNCLFIVNAWHKLQLQNGTSYIQL